MKNRLEQLSIITDYLVSKIPDNLESKSNIIQWLNDSPYSPYIKLYGGENAIGYNKNNSFESKLDNKKRFMIDDEFSFKLQNFQNFDDKILSANTRLYNIIEASKLFEYYPEFKDIEVNINISNSNNSFLTGSTYHDNNKAKKIDVFADNNTGAMMGLLHELQHSIQLKEGFAIGASYYNENGVMDLFVGSLANERGGFKEGSFSDIPTKKSMFEIDDSAVKLKKYPYSLHEALDNYRTKTWINEGDALMEEIYDELKHFHKYSEARFFEEAEALQSQVKELMSTDDFESVIDDVKELTDRQKPYNSMKTLMSMRKYGKLSDYIEHGALFEKYPELENISVRYGEIGEAKGQYLRSSQAGAKQIVLSDNYFGSEHLKENVLSTLLHEIQHAIQDIENWARGGSLEMFKDIDMSKLKKEDLINQIKGYIDYNFNAGTSEYQDAIRMINSKNNIEKGRNILQSNPEYKAEYANYIMAYKDLAEAENMEYETDILTKFEQYQSLWGEQQARAVQYRMKMNDSERQSESWTETLEKVEGEYREPIVRYLGKLNEAAVLEKALLDKDNKVDLSKLEQYADEFDAPFYKFEDFKSSFNTEKNVLMINSPLGDVEINLKSQYYKLKKWKENRLHLSGLIQKTIENPLFIVQHNEAKKYYAPYICDKGLKHIVSVTEGKEGVDILKSNYEPFSIKRIEKLIKVPDEHLLYASSNITNQVRNHSNAESIEDAACKESISKSSNNVNYISKEDREANFKKWFRDSKVADDNGEPLVVYHGTNNDFNVFDKTKRGTSTDKGMLGKAFYFTQNKSTAECYGQNIKEVHLHLSNPLMISEYKTKAELAEYLSVHESILTIGGTGIKALQSFTGVFSDAIKEKGHDGVITKHEIAVFEPTQIKSIHNNGCYDPVNPNILEKNDQGLKHIEKVISIIPDNTNINSVKDYLEFNNITQEHLNRTIYKNCMANDIFINPICVNNLNPVDRNSSYYKNHGEVESREIEDVYSEQNIEDVAKKIAEFVMSHPDKQQIQSR